MKLVPQETSSEWVLELPDAERLELQLIILYQISTLEHRLASVNKGRHASTIFSAAEITRWNDQLTRLRRFSQEITPEE